MASTPKLVSMKRSEKDKRSDAGDAVPMEAIAPDYPYGLCINLDKDEIDKLGMKQLPSVGTVVPISASAKVTMVRQSAVEGADEETSLTLQITDLAVG